jgi:putative sigma-54 modulation protein
LESGRGGYHPHVKVVVHDRTEGLPARVREYAEQRLLRVARHFDRVVEAEVEFAPEARRGGTSFCAVQINVRMDGRRHPLAQARETGTDPKGALDLALDKVDRQVVKLKEKIKVEKKRPAAPVAERERERDPGPERIVLKLRPETLDDAVAALDTADQPFYVFLEEETGAVNVCFRRPDGGVAVIEPVVP